MIISTIRRLLLTAVLFPIVVVAYPLDGYEKTGIRRLDAARLAVLGKVRGRKQPPGALLPNQYVDLRLLDFPDLELPAANREFTAKIVKLLGADRKRYEVAVLDISDPSRLQYAEHRGDYRQNVGSVGKLLVALALFQTLADIYPDDIEARKAVLRDTRVTADQFIKTDSHKVHIWDPVSRKLTIRRVRVGDQATLWEWLDWTMSASSNAAAAMLMKQVILLKQYGKAYPVDDNESTRFFNDTPRKELSEFFLTTLIAPLSRNGLDSESFRQGSFFTHYGKKKIPGTSSLGTVRQLMLFLLRMEQGRIVDTFSSREIKRLLYMTERRIRYAASPALADSAVYFKSGSLYQCKPEADFVCKKHQGNIRNYMSSVALIETPVAENRINYMVTLMSNILYENAAVAHQTLGTRIHRIIEAMHPQRDLLDDGAPNSANFGEHLIGYVEKRQQRMQAVSIQMALKKLGYSIGDVDGKVGSKTRKAIKKFQSSEGLPINGKASESLLEKLNGVVDGQ